VGVDSPTGSKVSHSPTANCGSVVSDVPKEVRKVKALLDTLRKIGNPKTLTQPINKLVRRATENQISIEGINDLYSCVQQTHNIQDFIRALDSVIPDCHPSVTMSEREIWIKVGERNLVSRLVTILEDIENNEPED